MLSQSCHRRDIRRACDIKACECQRVRYTCMTHSLYAQGMVSFMQSPISTDDDDTTAPEVAVFESSRE